MLTVPRMNDVNDEIDSLVRRKVLREVPLIETLRKLHVERLNDMPL